MNEIRHMGQYEFHYACWGKKEDTTCMLESRRGSSENLFE
jgi:hypothetical protein